MKVARCIYFTDIGILSIVLDSALSTHPWMLRPLSSNEDTKTKFYLASVSSFELNGLSIQGWADETLSRTMLRIAKSVE